jgi:hypothetical protein
MDAIPGGARGRSEPAIRSVRCGRTWRRALGRSGGPRTWLSARRAISFCGAETFISSHVCILRPIAGWLLISSELFRRGSFSVRVPRRPPRDVGPIARGHPAREPPVRRSGARARPPRPDPARLIMHNHQTVRYQGRSTGAPVGHDRRPRSPTWRRRGWVVGQAAVRRVGTGRRRTKYGAAWLRRSRLQRGLGRQRLGRRARGCNHVNLPGPT